MKNFIFLISISLVFFSCESDDELKACDVQNPIENLEWLKNQIEELREFSGYKYQYVLLSKYNNQTVFIFADCCPTCNSIYLVYSCNGENIGYIGGDSIPNEVFEEGELIWKSENNICDF